MVENVINGTINTFKVVDTATTSGGALAKCVPRPKAEDPEPYLKSLNSQ